ncbi:MAG: hypothetical protein DDT31_02003 [Syntrophomonadaceae bacterium]|nr:hypothetical protein [Bacillota bacterium]
MRLRLKAPYGIKILPFLPIWWCFEFFWLMVKRWDIVHAINFDSIIPAVIAGKLKRRPVIYEIFDVYADMVVLPQLVRRIGIYIDKIFMRLANAVIIVDETRLDQLNEIPNTNIAVIYNSPPDFSMQVNSSCQTRGNVSKFSIFYAGLLSTRRSLDKIIMAVKAIEDTELIIAGFGDQVKEIKKSAAENPGKVHFIGQATHTEVLELTSSANLLFSLYDPVVPQHKFASSNKLFEAMMANKPILVSKGTTMADIVERENCGLIVDCNSVDEIKKAIVRLKDSPELCRQLGANGRRAYEQKYNWEIMEQRLLSLYQEIDRKGKQDTTKQ